MLRFLSNNHSFGYAIMKIKLDSKESDLSTLPYDNKSLIKTYKELITGYSRKLTKTGFTLKDSNIVNYKGFLVYKFDYKNNQIETAINKTMLLILDEYAYIFAYLDQDNKNTSAFDEFLDSISINTERNPSQTIGKTLE
jgi:hypothetical protein